VAKNHATDSYLTQCWYQSALFALSSNVIGARMKKLKNDVSSLLMAMDTGLNRYLKCARPTAAWRITRFVWNNVKIDVGVRRGMEKWCWMDFQVIERNKLVFSRSSNSY
jgi:hypothetical protein